MTNELEQLYSSKAAILTEQQDRLRKFQESLVSTVQSVLSSIQSSHDPELLVARSALEATLRDTENQPMMLEPKVQFVPKLIFQGDRRGFHELLDALNTYTVPTDAEPGHYMLNVCLDGVHIHGSPFAVTCLSAL